MQISPYLGFNGQCEEAFKFYEQVLGGKIEAMLPHEGTPAAEHVPENWRSKIMHARLVIDGQVLMGGDVPPDYYQPPKGITISISLKDPAQAERIYNALSKDGRVTMPFQETFWAVRFGMFVDRYGTPWMINCEKAS